MQIARFFEDREGPGGKRRLLIGVADFDGSMEIDGGRREAVKLATVRDAERFPQAYRDYYEAFEQTAPGQT